MNAFYVVGIEAKKSIPFQTLSCLLGVEWQPKKCDQQPSVADASWVLTSSGKVIAQSGSEIGDAGAFSDDTIVREIGSFHLEKGRLYQLDVDFSADGSALAATDPHLKVEVGGGHYEDDAVMGFLLFWLCASLTVFGLFIVVFKVARHLSPKPNLSLLQ